MDEFTFHSYKATFGAATSLESSVGGEAVPLLTPDRDILYGITTTVPPRVFVKLPPHLVGVGKPYPQAYARYDCSAIGDGSGFTSAASPDARLGVPVPNQVQLHQTTIDGRIALGADSDFDGIPNVDELAGCSLDSDCDDDGVIDGDDANSDPSVGAHGWDSDGDGLPDGLERAVTSPILALAGVGQAGTDTSATFVWSVNGVDV